MEEKRVKVREKKGITLMVLIITIVVMIILAGTIIVSVVGYGDLKNLKAMYNDLQALQEQVHIYYEKAGELPVTGEAIDDDFVTLFAGARNANDGEDYYKIDLTFLDNINLTYGKQQFDKDYFIVNELSHNVYYYAGFDVEGETFFGIMDIERRASDDNVAIQEFRTFELKTNVTAVESFAVANVQLEVYTDLTGYNYKFKINDEDWTPEQTSNKYTFNDLKRSETYKVSMMIIDENNNEIFASNNGMKITIGELPINATIDGKLTGTYNNPIIPAGFTPITENDAKWNSSDGFKKGLVITDEVDEDGVSIGNEFVWVPVDGEKVKFERTDFNKGSVAIDECIETVPTNITNSVNANGGFYIARYDTGNVSNVLVSKKGATVWNNIDFTESKNEAEAMYPVADTEHGVISTLIYGAQWDAALNFITAYNVGEVGYSTYATSSIGMGNYSSGDDYTDITAPIATGSSNAFRQKNIYDMAGNVYERTMEKNSDDSRALGRGGAYTSDGQSIPAAYRNFYNHTSVYPDLSFRVALYIES